MLYKNINENSLFLYKKIEIYESINIISSNDKNKF